ncbi:isoprenyl transferase [Thorsellia anophelis]|nr:isoprenyl transferase [Thorsellia anophelis]
MEENTKPKHVAIIMDGNGRWAKLRGKLRISGHRAGANAVRTTVKAAISANIKVLTLYAFSSENWRRPSAEVTGLMELFLRSLKTEVPKLHENNIKLQVIGDISGFNQRLQNEIAKAHELTKNNSGLKLNIAANYGGRWDITDSVKTLFQQIQTGQQSIEAINETMLTELIADRTVSDVDLLIRTGGECRISNFLLWQIAYAELYFTDCFWPDFNEDEFNTAIAAFSNRIRRFGGL